ncbi:MAG: hypothetical protein R3F11_18855 [Verrucomicrobiales bacterium]
MTGWRAARATTRSALLRKTNLNTNTGGVSRHPARRFGNDLLDDLALLEQRKLPGSAKAAYGLRDRRRRGLRPIRGRFFQPDRPHHLERRRARQPGIRQRHLRPQLRADAAHLHRLRNDDIAAAPRTNNWIATGPGDDIIRPGLADTAGGTGDDLLVLDFSADDQPGYAGAYVNGGYRRNLAAAPFTLVDEIRFFEFERYHVTGTGKTCRWAGKATTSSRLDGDDTITGYGGNDILTGDFPALM